MTNKKLKFKREVSAGGIVYKNTDQGVYWLIVQPTAYKGWGFPKGHVGDKIKDETMEEAALREVEEEGGIKSRIISGDTLKKEYIYQRAGFLIKKTVFYFLMEYISGDIADHDHEISDIKFTDTNDVRKMLTFQTDKDAFEKALVLYQNNGSPTS